MSVTSEKTIEGTVNPCNSKRTRRDDDDDYYYYYHHHHDVYEDIRFKPRRLKVDKEEKGGNEE
jgi:hypothetical protein